MEKSYRKFVFIIPKKWGYFKGVQVFSFWVVKIPNFVGVYGTPVFPVTESYAKHVLIVYKPWRTYPRLEKWIPAFNNFINSPGVPLAAYLPYMRVMKRYIDKTVYCEPKAAEMKASKDGMTKEDKELLDLVGLKGTDDSDFDTKLLKSLDKGFDHNWNQKPKVSR